MLAAPPEHASPFQTRLAATETIIWDLDNTLYRFDRDFVHACNVAAARAGIEGGAPLTFEEATEKTRESFRRFGLSTKIFAVEYGIPIEDLHALYHSFIDEAILKASQETVMLFEETNLTHVLVTHASGDWARRALIHLGLRPWFPDDRILALEDYDFEHKSQSPKSFEKALALTGTDPARAVVVEDTPENLAVPQRLGMATVLIHHGRPPDPLPGSIDAAYQNTPDFLRDVKTGRE